jgi:AraC family transcriptional regulator of adaptative response/methylated-DNA-[protein]-cysteine methyltransferase
MAHRFERKIRSVHVPLSAYAESMDAIAAIPADTALEAWDARDRSFDGCFVVGVKTTRIYCRPSCPARRPRRENIEIFREAEMAMAAGFRACKRCRPDDMSREEEAVAQTIAVLRAADGSVTLASLADKTGYSPSHLQRIFKRAVGLSPAAYGRALRLERASEALSGGSSVTDALYDAGYGSASRF